MSTVKLLDVISGTYDLEHTYTFMVMEHFETDLASLLHNSEKVNLTEDHVITIFYNILCALNVVHTSNIMHRDIKPANILVNESGHVRICDFGLSRPTSKKVKLPSKETIAQSHAKKSKFERLKSKLLLRIKPKLHEPDIPLTKEETENKIVEKLIKGRSKRKN